MSSLETVLFTALGAALIGFAARDIFDALFHPEGKGSLGRAVMRLVWAAFRLPPLRSPKLFPTAGPLALIAVIGSWAAMLAVGWALIYLPQLDNGFSGPGSGDDFVEALHVSLVTLTTLGLGDISITEQWLRVVAPLEGLLGFGLLSASISWLLLIYPVLSRRRSLAYEVWLLREAEREGEVPLGDLERAARERIYAELTPRLVAVERDLVNFPVSYYFVEGDHRFSLAATGRDLLRLAQRGQEDDAAEVRLAARMLLEALEDLAATTTRRFHRRPAPTTAEALAAYAEDHMRARGGGL